MKTDYLKPLEARIGHEFGRPELLYKAMTHSSVGRGENYERLEFLGDRVVGLALAHTLFKKYPDENEGDLAKRHAALVRGKLLAEIARDIELGKYMKLSDPERAAGGAENENILADGLEALIGALYLDAGFEKCQDVIENIWGRRVDIMRRPPQDPKTALQEWAQARGLSLPAYEMVDRTGPDHAPIFEIRVNVGDFPPWAAKGTSRRAAEKLAAAMLLAHLEEIEAK
jgi:ribonuclease-3